MQTKVVSTASYVNSLTTRILSASGAEGEGEGAELSKVAMVQAIYMFSTDAFSFRRFFQWVLQWFYIAICLQSCHIISRP